MTSSQVVWLDMLVSGVTYEWTFHVLEMTMPMILGINFFEAFSTTIDVSAATLKLAGVDGDHEVKLTKTPNTKLNAMHAGTAE